MPADLRICASNTRNKHDFIAEEAARPDWDPSLQFEWTKTKHPSWTFGSGADPSSSAATYASEPIDPHAAGRAPELNYRLITSAVVPRPTALISTRSADGRRQNLAPYSFFQAMNHDPPIFVFGNGGGRYKDTLANLQETGECVIHVMTEELIEAGNACAIDCPGEVSEWDVSGLTQEGCRVVRPKRIREAVWAVECTLLETKSWESKQEPGKKSGTMAIVEGVHFWVRKGAVDAERRAIDPKVSKPVGRLFGIAYGRITQGFQIPWPSWRADGPEMERKGVVKTAEEGK